MASNFGIAVDKNRDGFGLKLAGDFDATSAYELMYAIKKLPYDSATARYRISRCSAIINRPSLRGSSAMHDEKT
jgi:hypothetical protein